MGRAPRHGTRYWLVDPLDGTREFVKRNGEFTVNIALIEDGAPVFGVVLRAGTRRAVALRRRGVGAFVATATQRRADRARARPPPRRCASPPAVRTCDPRTAGGARAHGRQSTLLGWARR